VYGISGREICRRAAERVFFTDGRSSFTAMARPHGEIGEVLEVAREMRQTAGIVKLQAPDE
jgi:hypothetical protein